MEDVAAALRRRGDLVCKRGIHGRHPEVTNRRCDLAATRPRARRRGGRRRGREQWRSGRSVAGRRPNSPGGGGGAAAAGGRRPRAIHRCVGLVSGRWSEKMSGLRIPTLRGPVVRSALRGMKTHHFTHHSRNAKNCDFPPPRNDIRPPASHPIHLHPSHLQRRRPPTPLDCTRCAEVCVMDQAQAFRCAGGRAEGGERHTTLSIAHREVLSWRANKLLIPT